MLIDYETGNVGIGTSTPSAKFNVVTGALAAGVHAGVFNKSRDVTNGHVWLFDDVGGLSSDPGGGAAWRAFQLGSPILTVSGSAAYPRLSFYAEYDSLTDPTSRIWTLDMGNSPTALHDFQIRSEGSPLLTVKSTGNVGIGTTSPTTKFHVVDTLTATGTSVTNSLTTNSSNATTSTFGTVVHNTNTSTTNITAGGIRGIEIYATNNTTSNLSAAYGSVGVAQNSNIGTVSTAWGVYGTARNGSTGIVSNAYGGSFDVLNTGGGTITSGIGVYIGGVAGTTNKHSLYASDATAPSYFAGNVGIGTTSPTQKLEVAGKIKMDAASPELIFNRNTLTPTTGGL